MKSKVNKKVLIVLFCVVAACAAVLVIMLAHHDSSPSITAPYKDLKKEDISKVIMYHGKIQAQVGDDRMDEFVDLLKAINTGKITTDTQLDGFERGRIWIYYTDGTVEHVSTCGDLFDIDGVTYESEYDTCQALGKMWSDYIYGENYGVK